MRRYSACARDEAHGFLFYVMPFIDGETLRSRLDRETQLTAGPGEIIVVDNWFTELKAKMGSK